MVKLTYLNNASFKLRISPQEIESNQGHNDPQTWKATEGETIL